VGRSAATTEDPRDLYDALAPIYDAWQAGSGMTPFALVAEAKLRPRLERAAAAGGPFAFLDAGCGTGTLLHELRDAHPDWRLAGLDASRGMLAVAAAKPGAGSIGFARASLADPLPFAHPFDAAGAFYDTLNHLPDEQALARALAALAGAVRPGGLVVFDLTNRLGFERWWRGCNDFRAAQWRLTINARFDPTTGVGTADIRVERGPRPLRFKLTERLFTEAQVSQALTAAGLETERTEPWSPFDIDVPGKTWWVARRLAT
jgi:SAM-dependent methyltransferase